MIARVLLGLAASVAASLVPVVPALAQAGDWRAGRLLAARSCQACHGMDGLSKQANAPNIGGQPEEYLVAQLRAYRDGTRRQEQMSIAAEGLTDEQILALVAYYSAIEVEAVRIPGRD
ncbi:c-type cytochrome [Elioraea rosea]|uniref:c-type cytochrome n=1 Tax=Elioraea rosea TaxID=2492390 RepID=UPI00194E989D|nr:cytochrome c [Elioraea rosea]